MQPQSVLLDHEAFSPDLEEIMAKLKARTIGQDHAVEAFGRIFETWSPRPAQRKTLSRGRGRSGSLPQAGLCFGWQLTGSELGRLPGWFHP